jgi:murein L,D-transpeptidase YafK
VCVQGSRWREANTARQDKAWGSLWEGDFALHRHSVSRSLFVFVAITSTVALAGCYSETTAPVTARHMQPLSERSVADLESRNMEKGSPILVRIFKEESELEVWKLDNTGCFALLRAYPICRWSGDLGPKFQQGDRQAPEGFHSITPDPMNPNSSAYLVH